MWSLFSRDPTKDLSYDIGPVVHNDLLQGRSLWELHTATHRTSGELGSAFVYNIKDKSSRDTEMAKAAFKLWKTLRHPCMLNYVEGVESDRALYVVTENVQPLIVFLQESQLQNEQRDLLISWGLYQLASLLSFLNQECHIVHNNVCAAAIFVNRAGEFRLGNLEYSIKLSDGAEVSDQQLILFRNKLPQISLYNPPEISSGKTSDPATSADSYGFAFLLWELYNGLAKRGSEDLKSLGSLPNLLHSDFKKLSSAQSRQRMKISSFLENCRRRPNGFMCNKFVDTLVFLDELQIKDTIERKRFFGGLCDSLDDFPLQTSKYKILPQLINAFEFTDSGSALLTPLFKLGTLLDFEEYQKQMIPCVVKLFMSPDRQTRVRLLEQLEHFAEFLSADIINDKLFGIIIAGFSDTNPVVRESTIKAMLYLAPKLNYKNLNDELMKHFARIQLKDEQGGIRTNTTVCLGKIANFLNPQVRQNILAPAFLRALKDPFPPARQAGVIALAACNGYFTVDETARRILPSLCLMAVDPEKQIREKAFKTLRGLLDRLEKVSENPELLAEIEKDVNTFSPTQGGASGSSGWAGWAVGSLAGMFRTKMSQPTIKSQGEKTPSADKPAITVPAITKRSESPSIASTCKVSLTDQLVSSAHSRSQGFVDEIGKANVADGDVWGEGQSAWGDEFDEEWGDLESAEVINVTKEVTNIKSVNDSARPTEPSDSKTLKGVESKDNKEVRSQSSTNSNFSTTERKGRPDVRAYDSEWSAFGDDELESWSSKSEGNGVKVTKASMPAETQPKQDQMLSATSAIPSKGPMKLGAKKVVDFKDLGW